MITRRNNTSFYDVNDWGDFNGAPWVDEPIIDEDDFYEEYEPDEEASWGDD